jgi:predicted nucleic acid-binding protein
LIVVDTNVIAYLIIYGDKTALAEAVLELTEDWLAPKLWRSEMRNLLLLYARQGQMTLEEIQEHMNDAEMFMSDREFEVESNGTLELAKSSGCSSYDCEFVWLAKKLELPLVTEDKKVLTAFPDIAVSMKDFIS